MKAISTHSIEHIKVHLAYEEMRTRLLTSLRSLSKKVSGSTEKMVAASVVILVGLLFVTAFMKLGECSIVNTYYYGRLLRKQKSIPVALYWSNQRGRGVHVNVSGAGIVKYARHPQAA